MMAISKAFKTQGNRNLKHFLYKTEVVALRFYFLLLHIKIHRYTIKKQLNY
jgi:hypothetical protein